MWIHCFRERNIDNVEIFKSHIYGQRTMSEIWRLNLETVVWPSFAIDRLIQLGNRRTLTNRTSQVWRSTPLFRSLLYNHARVAASELVSETSELARLRKTTAGANFRTLYSTTAKGFPKKSRSSPQRTSLKLSCKRFSNLLRISGTDSN